MAETDGGAASTAGSAQPTFRVLAQFLKDLSFENPGLAQQMPQGNDERAQVKVDVNVAVNKLADSVFESVLEINTAAKTSKGILYNVEVSYGGVFRLEGIPEAAIQPALFINAPTLLYPFVRRLVADVTRDGGYPPLLLDPIDFAGLYAQNRGKINATVN
ncbi:MAG: protein-export chaperone SecB [Hyphomicrobiaceae bacterium]